MEIDPNIRGEARTSEPLETVKPPDARASHVAVTCTTMSLLRLDHPEWIIVV